jgi:hypothetical protein
MVHYGPPGKLDEAGELEENWPCTWKDHAAAAR